MIPASACLAIVFATQFTPAPVPAPPQTQAPAMIETGMPVNLLFDLTARQPHRHILIRPAYMAVGFQDKNDSLLCLVDTRESPDRYILLLIKSPSAPVFPSLDFTRNPTTKKWFDAVFRALLGKQAKDVQDDILPRYPNTATIGYMEICTKDAPEESRMDRWHHLWPITGFDLLRPMRLVDRLHAPLTPDMVISIGDPVNKLLRAATIPVNSQLSVSVEPSLQPSGAVTLVLHDRSVPNTKRHIKFRISSKPGLMPKPSESPASSKNNSSHAAGILPETFPDDAVIELMTLYPDEHDFNFVEPRILQSVDLRDPMQAFQHKENE